MTSHVTHFSKQITIIGCGPAGSEYLPPISLDLINQADIMIGSRRLLALYTNVNSETIEITSDIPLLLSIIEKQISSNLKIAVLVSGDTGIASIASTIIKKFGKDLCQCIPGISSVQLACARLCIDWIDSLIISAHKEIPHISPDAIQNRNTVILLCGNLNTWPWVLTIAKNLDCTHHGYRCADLGNDNESIILFSYSDIASFSQGGGNAVLVWRRKDFD